MGKRNHKQQSFSPVHVEVGRKVKTKRTTASAAKNFNKDVKKSK